MIDDDALKVLVEIHARSSAPPGCLLYKDKAIVHSPMLALELPLSDVQLKKRVWPSSAWPEAAQWRDRLPKDLKYLTASAIRGVDNLERDYVQFETRDGTSTAYAQGLLYDLLRDLYDNPVFRIMDAPHPERPELRLGLGVFVDDVLVGVVGPLLPPDVG